MEKQRAAFIEEARELLAELETSLLALEDTPDDPDQINRVFRELHTIKGSGSMFGFDEIAAFTHEVESVFDLVRNGELLITRELIDLTLSARDCIQYMLDTPGQEEDQKPVIERLVKAFKNLVTDQTIVSGNVTEERDTVKKTEITWWIRFTPFQDLFFSGTNPLPLLKELKSLGECVILADTSNIPHLSDLDPEKTYTRWDVFLTTTAELNAIRDVFIFVENRCDLSIEPIVIDGKPNDLYFEVIRQLVKRGDLVQDLVKAGKNTPGDIIALFSESLKMDTTIEKNASPGVNGVDSGVEKKSGSPGETSLRITSGKVDALMNLAGEMVTIQARLTRIARMRDDPELIAVAEEVERLTGELRENAMRIRMVPLETTLTKFQRLVRDLSIGLGKETVLMVEGGETELDKTMIECLNDPLIHIIRNSIDHGIELPEEREALGKPRRGEIHLTASHQGSNVLIRISDDGRGVDREAVQKKAMKNRFVSSDTELSESEILDLVFQPGLSTSNRISDLSGRGVGMDIVKKNIERLRGTVEIESRPGKGTVVVLKIPLTLAIIEGLHTVIGNRQFVVPLSAVEECIELPREEAVRARERFIMNLRGSFIPFIDLRDLFEIPGETPAIESIVIVRSQGRKIGFGVDRVIGQHQTVLKSLGKFYKNLKGLAGATILGDGTVALVIDVYQLIRLVEKS